jgi:ribosomal-protein-alanine N-acetyltransferase
MSAALTLSCFGRGRPSMAADNKAIASASLQIRPFRPSDMAPISEILRGAAEAAQWSPESYTKLASLPGGVFLVCEGNANVMGFLAARQVADEAEILNIAVHPDFRRRGIATALLITALDKFRCANVSGVFLELRESNHAARSLYERHGFVPNGKRKAYYRDPGEDALCMQKKLTADVN